MSLKLESKETHILQAPASASVIDEWVGYVQRRIATIAGDKRDRLVSVRIMVEKEDSKP